MTDPTDVTLGEVWRGLQNLQQSLSALTSSVSALRADLLREVDVQITDRQQLLQDRVSRLEKVVYGAIALVLSSVAISVLALVLKGAPS